MGIMRDQILEYLSAVEVFATSQGRDVEARRRLIKSIQKITGEDSLDTIYVNTLDNFHLPDIVVMPLYNTLFNLFLLDGNLANTSPFGYTIEVHVRCFTKYTTAELGAAIIHDILHNITSCTAKTRFMKAYNTVMRDYRVDDVLNMFDDISSSEVYYMIYLDICARTFTAPVVGKDYIGTDEVLCSIGLGDAYDDYLNKRLSEDEKNKTPDDRIIEDTKADHRTTKTVFGACISNEIRAYYTMFREAFPLLTLEHVYGSPSSIATLGFVSRQRSFKKRNESNNNEKTAMTESFNNPHNEVDIRYQVDLIISDMRYCESEPERQVILIKIRNMTLKLMKTRDQLVKALDRNHADRNAQYKYDYVVKFLNELESLRASTVKMEIKKRKYGLFVEYPVGYEG